MILTIDNRSRARLPRAFLLAWAVSLSRELKHLKVASKVASKVISLSRSSELRLIFVDSREMRRLNRSFRGKDYATDVLSFESDEPGCVGELVICPSVIAANAVEHGLSLREEYAYMVLHGVLHLLGFDHEGSAREAKKMFDLQDSVFDRLLPARGLRSR